MSDTAPVGKPVPGRPDLVQVNEEPILVVPNPHHSARTKARKQALDILFEAELRDRDLVTTLDEHIAEGQPGVRQFARDIIRGIDAHIVEVDDRIDQCCNEQWTLERMPRVDRNLARIGIWEIDHGDTAVEAVIGEVVGLATEFSTEESAPFLNGLLAQAARTRPAGEDDEVADEPTETEAAGGVDTAGETAGVDAADETAKADAADEEDESSADVENSSSEQA